MADTSQEFNYNPSNASLIIATVMITASAFLMGNFAIDNHEDLHLFGTITLSPSDATLFLWGMTILCGYSALNTFFIVFASLRHPKQVELHTTYAILPKLSIFGGQLSIPYEVIKDITRRKISASEELLVIQSAAGESRLLSSGFKGLLDYEDFLSALSEKVSLPHL